MQKKVISFSIDGLGLCTDCSSGVLFEEEAPETSNAKHPPILHKHPISLYKTTY